MSSAINMTFIEQLAIVLTHFWCVTVGIGVCVEKRQGNCPSSL